MKGFRIINMALVTAAAAFLVVSWLVFTNDGHVALDHLVEIITWFDDKKLISFLSALVSAVAAWAAWLAAKEALQARTQALQPFLVPMQNPDPRNGVGDLYVHWRNPDKGKVSKVISPEPLRLTNYGIGLARRVEVTAVRLNDPAGAVDLPIVQQRRCPGIAPGSSIDFMLVPIEMKAYGTYELQLWYWDVFNRPHPLWISVWIGSSSPGPSILLGDYDIDHRLGKRPAKPFVQPGLSNSEMKTKRRRWTPWAR